MPFLTRAGRLAALAALLAAPFAMFPSDHPVRPAAVELCGHNFAWNVRYQHPNGRWTPAIATQSIHLPTHWRGPLALTSRDYVYTFHIPAIDFQDLAIPGESIRMQMIAGPTTSTVVFRGDQFCGFAHPRLSGTIEFVDQRQWRATVRDHLRAVGGPD